MSVRGAIVSAFVLLFGGCATASKQPAQTLPPSTSAPPPSTVSTRPRPKILLEQESGVASGVMVNQKFGKHGNYLRKVIEAVQVAWDRAMLEEKEVPPPGSKVMIKFVLNAEGRIARILEVENRSTERAAAACVRAITNPMPYAKWTPEMKVDLGDEQEMTFTFYYQ